MSEGKLRTKPKCISCGELLDSFWGRVSRPSPGDIACCGYCGELQAFGPKLRTMRSLTEQQKYDLAGRAELKEITALAAKFSPMIRRKL